MASVLAYALVHCVTGLTLPRVDATSFFIKHSACAGCLEKKVNI
jgi:hypothetical protein